MFKSQDTVLRFQRNRTLFYIVKQICFTLLERQDRVLRCSRDRTGFYFVKEIAQGFTLLNRQEKFYVVKKTGQGSLTCTTI